MTEEWTEVRSSFRDYTLHSNAIYAMVDSEGACIYVNPAWTTFTGQSQEEALGDGWQEVIHPRDLQHCIRVLTYGVTNAISAQAEFRFKHQNDGYQWFSACGKPLLRLDGNYDSYTCRLEAIQAPERRNLDGTVYHLTDREREVLTLIAMGKTSDEVGTILDLSRRTVDSHVAAAIEKTNASNRIQAVVEGIKRGEIIL